MFWKTKKAPEDERSEKAKKSVEKIEGISITWGNYGMLDNYSNAIEAGRRLKIHPETVKRLCRQGVLPAIKIHNTWLIARDVLDNFAGTYSPKPGARKKLI